MKNQFIQSLLSICSFMLVICLTSTVAQERIDALDIERDIKAGTDVVYRNVTIAGVLDMTEAREKSGELKRKMWDADNTIEHTLKGDIRFENCVFDDHVYAYLQDDDIDHTPNDSKYTFVAHFDGVVEFVNCKFQKRAWFKYSDFSQKSDFSGTLFRGSSSFKYAEFPKQTSFAGASFLDDSSFKYTDFEQFVSFADTKFKYDGNFKYAEFEGGVSFENAEFKDGLNFKYVDIDQKFIDNNMVINGDWNTKYAEIAGQSSSRYGRKSEKCN